MKRRIRIGYIGHNYSWEQLLEQIGADWGRLEPGNSIDIQDYSCLIVDRQPDRTERTAIDNYLESGGAVLDASGSFCPEPVQTRKFSVITPDSSDNIFSHIGEIAVYCKAHVNPSRGFLDGTVWMDPAPGRHVAFCGLPVSRLWRGYRTVHKTFGTSDGALTAERTSALQSRPYMDVVLALLTLLHDRSNLPFVHKWWHPESSKQAATLRIDSDYSDLKSIRSVSKIAKASGVPLTWFLHAEHHEKYLNDLIQKLPGHNEIALHCYRHSEYRTPEQYLSDIQRGITCLTQYGITPVGYAAPYGHWSEILAEALTKFPFRYSSEFSYDFDSLPSVSQASGILQLPVHPVSIGSFHRFKSDAGIPGYFEELTRLNNLKHQPLHLYHHPLDGSMKLWENLVSLFSSDDYILMTYLEWSDWWNRRLGCVSTTFFDTDTRQLQLAHQREQSTPVGIHRDGNVHVKDSGYGSVHLEELTFHPYIATELKQLVRDRRGALDFTRFRLIKDKILTGLWRNRT